MGFSNFKEIDKTGRVVISKDIRKHLDIKPGDLLFINADENSIIIKKAEKSCVFCNSQTELRECKGKHVCAACFKELCGEKSE